MDCATAVERIIESNRELCGEVYNIGPDDNEIAIIEIAKKIPRIKEIIVSTDNNEIAEIAKKSGYVEKGDLLINLTAMPIDEKGMVNTLRVSTI